jgi:hypothetical protein
VTAPPQLNVAARLVLAGDEAETPVRSTSWFITHGLGKPAEGTFTEVAFADDVLELLAELHDEHAVEVVLDATVRMVAVQLYGQAWAFLYRPEQRDEALTRHGMRRREVVLVSALEVWS